MSALLFAYYLFALFYVLWLPAYLLGKVLYPEQRRAVRMGLGFAIVLALLPTACFGLAMVFQTVVTELMLFVVASLVSVAGVAVLLSRMKRAAGALEE